MQKIPTLFARDPEDMRYVTREVNPACQWVIDGEGVATRKYDGTCIMLDSKGQFWARREVKRGKSAPPNYVPIETDPNTGKTVGWEPVEQSGWIRWLIDALPSDDHILRCTPGTYELVGPRINGNPEQLARHCLWAHGAAEVEDVPRDFDGLSTWLPTFVGEGIVWHHPDGRMAKIKRRDFPAD